MPKIVSRSAVSSSTEGGQTLNQRNHLPQLYEFTADCICGEFILVIDMLLTSLPRRKTDNAIIIRAQDSEKAKARVFKLNANPAEPILLEREGGHERQYRFTCPRCALPVAYQMTPPPPKSSPFLYIFPGALTQVQGQIPQDAFDLDISLEKAPDEVTA